VLPARVIFDYAQSVKTCAFCPTEAAKLSGEHIWDDWLNRALPTKRFRVKQRRSTIEPFREYDAAKLNEKLTVVCEECNHNWMSDLTDRVKRSFSNMIINGTQTSLQRKDISLIAAYAFMKSVVADHATPKGDSFYAKAVRERFRETQVVPTNIQMWLAAYQGIHRFGGKFNTAFLTPNEPSPITEIEFYSFTYVIGHLVLQTLGARWVQIEQRGKPVPLLQPNFYWDPAVVRFWPNVPPPVAWPPAKYLGDDTIDNFIARFGVRITVR
jgi:hypothetical protein